MTIRHLLLDADGVLQDLPGGWYVAIEPYLGTRSREFLHATWVDELPMLAGDGDYLELLGESLARFGVTVPAEDVYRSVWHRIEPVEQTHALVRRLRDQGYGVHLATNQERHRGEYMRKDLGYDTLFDVSCYSYDLGFTKPDARFFHEAVRRIGAAPDSILFIDDNEPNVRAARESGLHAEHWHFEHGHDALVELLARHGIAVVAK